MWLTASDSITSMGWCTYLMHWHVECWVNTFFIGLSVSPWRPCSQFLFCHGRGIITPPPPLQSLLTSLSHTLSFTDVSVHLFFFFFSFHFLAHFAFIPLLCVKHQQPSLVAATHLSLLAVMSALIVSFWRRRTLVVDRCFNWLCVALSEVAEMDRWLGKEALAPAKNESCQAWNCEHTRSAHCQPAAVSHSPSARTEHDLARAVIFILQSWCIMWGILCSPTTLSH